MKHTFTHIIFTIFGPLKVIILFHGNLEKFVRLMTEQRPSLVIGFTAYAIVIERYVSSHVTHLITDAFGQQRAYAAKLANVQDETVNNGASSMFDVFFEVASLPVVSEILSVLLLTLYLFSFFLCVAIWKRGFLAATEETTLYVVLIAFSGIALMSQAILEAAMLILVHLSDYSALEKWRLFSKLRLFAIPIYMLFLLWFQIKVLRNVYVPNISIPRFAAGLIAIPLSQGLLIYPIIF